MKTYEKIIAFAFSTVVALLVMAASVGPVPQYTTYSIQFLTNASATTAQSYLAVTPSTNTAKLNGTNTFTGTNTFNTNTILGTNVANTLFGVGGRWRLLYAGASNTFSGTAVTLQTNIYAQTVTIPPLLSANSTLMMGFITHRTNATTEALWHMEVHNATTNGATVGGVSVGGTASQFGSTLPQPNTFLMANCGAFNYQWCFGSNWNLTSQGYNPAFDTTASITLSLLLWHTSAANCSPLTVERFWIWEIY